MFLEPGKNIPEPKNYVIWYCNDVDERDIKIAQRLRTFPDLGVVAVVTTKHVLEALSSLNKMKVVCIVVHSVKSYEATEKGVKKVLPGLSTTGSQ